MQALFALADAGMTTFDVSGPAWPYTSLHRLFGSVQTGSMYDLVERLLGTFKKRCALVAWSEPAAALLGAGASRLQVHAGTSCHSAYLLGAGGRGEGAGLTGGKESRAEGAGSVEQMTL